MAEFGAYQEDKLNALGMAKEAALWYVNPINRYMYDPSMWSVTRGAVRYNLNGGPVVKGARWLGSKINTLMGDPLVNNKKIQGFANKLNPMDNGKIFGKYPSQGWFGAAPMNMDALIANRSMEGPTSYIDDLVNEYVRSGKQLSAKEFIQRRKSRFMPTGRSAAGIDSKVAYGRLMKEQYNLYQKVTTFENLPFNQQKTMLASKMGSFRSQIKDLQTLQKTTNKAAAGAYTIDLSRGIDQLKSLKNKTYGELWKTRLKQTSLGAGKLGIRAAVGLGKLNAYYMTATLMWDAAQMIWNPLAQGAVRAVDNAFESFASISRPEVGGRLNMSYLSQGAATERQRAIQAISKSRINGRSVLGNEAMFMHQ